MLVHILIVNSNFYEDKIPKIVDVKENLTDALRWKQDYEERMDILKNSVAVPPRTCSDEDLDRYNQIKASIAEAEQFISVEIQSFELH